MIRRNRQFSFRRRMMAVLVCLCIMVAFVCIVVYNQASYQSFVEYARETQALSVSNQADQFDSQLSQIESLMLILVTNPDIKSLLDSSPEQAAAFSTAKKSAHQTLNNILFGYLPIAKRIGFLYIEGENGLVIRKGPYSYSIGPTDYQAAHWYQTAAHSTGQTVFANVIENYVKYTTEDLWLEYDWDYVLPVYKRLNQDGSGEKLGEIIIMLTADVIFPLADAGLDDSGVSQMLCSRDATVMFSSRPSDIGTSLAGSAVFDSISDREQGTELIKSPEGDLLVVFKRTELDGAYIIRTLSLASLSATWPLPGTTALAVLLSMLSALIASAAVSAYFSRPVRALNEKVNRIAAHPFTPSLEPARRPNCVELALLDQSIDEMQGNIVKLWEETLQKEQEKRTMEMRMLRMQINPHFLYNTLNSIKWMSVMQGAQGVATMIGSLTELVYAAFQQSEAEIPVDKELEILQHYIEIQKMQSLGNISFRVECDDPTLKGCAILIFTLQPLVENAVFHGIKPKR
ncbi:histidine kinase, partial [Eubacteriales bacterium OttesenSCG-928-N13]|nr:histidine kinase [Eubacteriales bacterium OttesenSCG-928-N13]